MGGAKPGQADQLSIALAFLNDLRIPTMERDATG
jgi:hypothetical protein